ncbi:hypothetical protein MNEG_14355 [Monoraphidium neglectum]|uniref:1-phosphatidylinositol-4-phosphate 5-kinase n=1 Tax=Monoraphidium neglectum TaxID=145388 RepID=A0A0D2J0N9_9CHLO|nr:hypothetical protein MNEG_14355 [Monoraphidium neglectum]KIY93607.1 hypothetical protein MNEG_14355 [Monoraphidium neglectum]|eukprot:XP_013892627.1 hypothetical protein MNEG_14355 [Monoraphidium neglectum]
MLALGGSAALRQLNSPGKSGSVFFLSDDERFLVKTMRKSEARVLLGMLPGYYAHVTAHPHTLITRFFGVHRITPAHGRAVRFVVMANIFVTDLQIHRRFDIKGSTEGRSVGEEARRKAEGDPSVIFKDLDVDFRLQLEPAAHDLLMQQLKADADLLRECGVMDYSLLLGIHYPSRGALQRASLDAAPSTDNAAAFTDALPSYRPTSESDTDAGEANRVMLARNFSGGGDPFAAAAASAVAGQQQQQRWQGDDSALLPPGAGLVPGGWPAAPPGGADRARNFDVHSNAAEVEEKLARIVERMEAMGFSEQRQRDIAELARLKILGGKLKKRSAARKEPAAAVLTAMQQARQESLGANAPGLASGDGGAGTGAAVAAAATGDGAAGAPALAPWTPPAGPGMASAR